MARVHVAGSLLKSGSRPQVHMKKNTLEIVLIQPIF